MPQRTSLSAVALHGAARHVLHSGGRISRSGTVALERWAAAETDAFRIAAALERAQNKSAAQHVLPHVSEEQIRPLLDRFLFGPGHQWTRLLAKNPGWNTGHAQYLSGKLVGHIEWAATGLERCERWAEDFAWLARQPHGVLEADVQKLISCTLSERIPGGQKIDGDAQVQIASVLLGRMGSHLGSSFVAVYRRWKDSGMVGDYASTVPGLMIHSEHTPDEVLRDLALDFYPHFTHRALAGTPRAVSDGVIRAALLTSPDPVALDLLFPRLSPSPAEAFREMAAHNPEAAARQLDRLPTGHGLAKADLMPLFSSPDAEIRLKAMTWWGVRSTESAANEAALTRKLLR